MSNKYIPQIDNQNFVFPNYDLAEYDVNIIHSIDSYSVSGTVTNFTGITVTSTGMTFTHDWSWSKNGADTFISESGNIHLLSVHMLAAGQDYFKPWRCIDLVTSGVTTGSTYSGSNTITVTPAQMGITQFAYGTYYFEFRFIGEKAIYPICYTYTATTIPTPTPTASPTPTPTMTPTPTATTVPPTPTSTPVPPTPTAVSYVYYEANVVQCSDCGPAPIPSENIKFVAPFTETAGKVYRADPFVGYFYANLSPISPDLSARLMNSTPYDNCAAVC
jgi:hypothetical protein